MKLIVAVDENFGIGCGNRLLYSIPEDMAFFRETTQGKVLVMGHSTLKSFPNAAPLKNRINIVLTRDKNLRISGAITCTGLPQLATVLGMCAANDIYVIGGESIYRLLLDYCDEAFITKICSNTKADSFFPNIDNMDNWQLIQQSAQKTHEGLEFSFCRYNNSSVKSLGNIQTV